MHENSLVNLKLWKQGQSGNPRGRSAAGGSIIEWMNLMAEWPEEGIRGVADDDGAPAAKRTAACRSLAAIDADNEKDAREAADGSLRRDADRLDRKWEDGGGKMIHRVTCLVSCNPVRFYAD